MHKITLTGVIGDELAIYEAVMPHRSGGDSWQLYSGDWYCGQLIFTQGQWRAYLNSGVKGGYSEKTGIDFYTEEIQVFIGEIEKLKATPPSHFV